LKELRHAAGLTQEQYAELAGIQYKVYQHIEAGRRPNPRLSTVERLAQGFGLSVSEFFAVRLPNPRPPKEPYRLGKKGRMPAGASQRRRNG